MGCVSSNFLEDEDGNVGAGGIGHHIVSLTSSTYGLLTTLDNPTTPQQHSMVKPSTISPPPPPPPPPPLSSSRAPFTPLRSEPEVINSWELMAGLDSSGTPFRTPKSSPFGTPKLTRSSSSSKATVYVGKENVHRALLFPPSTPADPGRKSNPLKPLNRVSSTGSGLRWSLDTFERRCPPGGEQAVVLYTTTLRGIRKTFENCNAVRAALEGLGVWIRERDVSMDMGFREELRILMSGTKDGGGGAVVPRLFVRGRYIGGAEEVVSIHEEGGLAKLVEGLPKARCGGGVCDGCGGARFLPCFQCSGSRKVVSKLAEDEKLGGGSGSGGRHKIKVTRCPDCNENGLVLCPICC